MKTVNMSKTDILKLLGCATHDTKKVVPNKYAKQQFLVETLEGVFGTEINIKGVFIKTNKGIFKTIFELIQIKIYMGDEVLFMGEDKNLLNGYFYEIFLCEDTTINVPQKEVKSKDNKSVKSILESMIGIGEK